MCAESLLGVHGIFLVEETWQRSYGETFECSEYQQEVFGESDMQAIHSIRAYVRSTPAHKHQSLEN